MKGGAAHGTGSRSSYPYGRRVRLDELDRGRVCGTGAPCEAAFLDYMADWPLHGRRRQSRRDTTYKNCPLPTPAARLLFILVYLKQHPTHRLHRRLFGMRQSKATQWMHVLLPVVRNALRTLGDAPCRRVEALCERLGVALPHLLLEPAPADKVHPTPNGAPFCHDGTECPLLRPHDATAQKACYSGKNKRPMLKNILLSNAALRMLGLRETHAGSVPDKRLADPTPYPLPAGSQLLQDLGGQASTLDGVDILQPPKKPRGKVLTRAQKAGHRKISRRRVRIEHVNSRVNRCRMRQATLRVWNAGIRAMVMEIGWALHNFRVRLTPSWTSMI
jgi:hypothetical protein